MSLSKDVKKDLLNDPESRNLLIYPFMKAPEKKDVQTIDTLANYYVNQMVHGFANYGFDITDDQFDLDILLVKQFVTAALYRNKRIAHSYLDILDDVRHLMDEAAETKEQLGDAVPSTTPEKEGD